MLRYYRREGGICLYLSVILILLLFTTGARGQGSLLLSPRRLVFEGTERVHEITVANNGRDTAKYAITLLKMDMAENGTSHSLKDSTTGLELLSKIKYYPKHVFLAPGETQVVKVQVLHRTVNKLETGEYRCHLLFKPIPKSKIGGPKMKKMVTKLSLKLRPVFSFTVPVIVRVGESTTRAEIKELSFTTPGDTSAQLNLTVVRTGNMSIYGDMYVFFEGADGIRRQIGAIKGFAVYTPYERRLFSLKLPTKNTSYRQGTFHVVCNTQVEERFVKIAEGELHLP